MANPQLNFMNGNLYITITSIRVASNMEYLIFKPYLNRDRAFFFCRTGAHL